MDRFDGSLEHLYGDTPDEKMRGISQVLTVCIDKQNSLEEITQNHQLMSALSRLLGEAETLPVDLVFSIAKLFFSLSLIEDYHTILSGHRVGALALGVIESCTKQLDSINNKYPSFSTRQEHLLLLVLSILNNLADDMDVLHKMMKKSLVSLLTRCIHQKSIEPIMVTLALLKMASIFEETAIELSSPGCSLISQLARLLTTPCIELQQRVLNILFNLSFHKECTIMISDAEGIHTSLVRLMQVPSLSTITIQLSYHLSSREVDRQKLLGAGVMSKLVDLLHHISPKENIDKGFAGLLVNVSLAVVSCRLSLLSSLIIHSLQNR